jgi:hypothetical protein
MSADQPLYDDSIEGVAAFYDDCDELNIPPVQYIAELPALYVSANGCECQRCNGDDGTRARARFVIEHDCLELRVRAECCPNHAADLVREIGGRPSGTRIEDWQQRETKQNTLDAMSGGDTEQEGEA